MKTLELLKEHARETDTYRLFNEFTGEFIEKLEGSEAIAKYGEWIYGGWYTTGWNDRGGVTADLWIFKGVRK